jgi:uncharacterized protein (UPF0335 family)
MWVGFFGRMLRLLDEAKISGKLLATPAADRETILPTRRQRVEASIRTENAANRAEAKADAFDVKVLKEIVRLRKQHKDERDEQGSLLDLYLRAMESAGAAPAEAA